MESWLYAVDAKKDGWCTRVSNHQRFCAGTVAPADMVVTCAVWKEADGSIAELTVIFYTTWTRYFATQFRVGPYDKCRELVLCKDEIQWWLDIVVRGIVDSTPTRLFSRNRDVESRNSCHVYKNPQ